MRWLLASSVSLLVTACTTEAPRNLVADVPSIDAHAFDATPVSDPRPPRTDPVLAADAAAAADAWPSDAATVADASIPESDVALPPPPGPEAWGDELLEPDPRLPPPDGDCTNPLEALVEAFVPDPPEVCSLTDSNPEQRPIPEECPYATPDVPHAMPIVIDADDPPRTTSSDAQGRLVRIERSDGSVETQSFDAAGRLVERRNLGFQGNEVPSIERWTYDMAGRVVRDASFAADGSGWLVVDHRYDDQGHYRGFVSQFGSDRGLKSRFLLVLRPAPHRALARALEFPAADGSLQIQTLDRCLHDVANRPTEFSSGILLDGGVWDEAVFDYRYDCLGRVMAELVFGNRDVGSSAYAYDHVGRLALIRRCQRDTVCDALAPDVPLRTIRNVYGGDEPDDPPDFVAIDYDGDGTIDEWDCTDL
jgi:YD repeat-containing protein